MGQEIKEIVVATKNIGKVTEIKAALSGLSYTIVSLGELGEFPEAPENGITFEENARSKAEFYARLTGKLCLADDSGLEVDYLKGKPGVYSARYAGEHASDQENNNKLLANLVGIPSEKRTARFRCVVALADAEKTLLTASGTVEGIMLTEPRGNKGFGYDPLFYVPKLEQTMAQMLPEEKNKISHRGRAIKALAEQLAELEK